MNRFFIAFFGYLIISFGVYMSILVQGVGLEPWSAATLALSDKMFTYGVWTIIFHVIFITITMMVEKRPPRIGTFINMLMIGPLVDLFLYLDFLTVLTGTTEMYLFYILSIVISSFGSSLVIVSEVGAGSKTQFYVTLHHKTKLSLSRCKNMVEAIGLTLALIFGGPIFIGTVLFIIISAFCVEKFVFLLKKQLVFKEKKVI